MPAATGKGWWNKVDGKVVSRHRLKETAVEAGREIAGSYAWSTRFTGRTGSFPKRTRTGMIRIRRGTRRSAVRGNQMRPGAKAPGRSLSIAACWFAA